MMLADFEPGIFFLLLWGLISWLTRKKKKKIPTDNGMVEATPKSKEDLFARLQKLQDHLSKDVDIFPSVPQHVEAEEEFIDEEYDYSFIESEILEPELEDLHENEESVFETEIKTPAAESENWLKQNLSRKSNLRKLMVLKEVLREPRSLTPYTGDYFQS